jgi:endothelin-converting enzyme/putative endopeptidase
MRRIAAVLLLALSLTSSPLFAQTTPNPDASKPKPTNPQPGVPPVADTPQGTPAPKEQPLTAMPYTPSLDVPSMDRTVNPCDDFYQYSCGGWIAHNPIPADQAAWSVYGKLADENSRFLWGVLEGLKPGTPNRTPVQAQIGDYFAACMDEAAIDKRGDAPIKPLLAEIDAIASKKALAKFLAAEHLRSSSRRFIFGFGSDQDYEDATQVIATAGAGGLGLPDRDYYTKDDAKSKDIRDKYAAHVAKTFELVGVPAATARKDAATVLSIETELAKASLTRVERRNPYNLAHKTKLADVEKLTPNFDWKTYLADTGAAGVPLINIEQPKFFEAVNKLIESVPLAEWKVYLKWHAVDSRAPFLSKPFVTESFNFYSKTLRGVQSQPPRWKRCVRAVDRDLGEALGQEFVRLTFTPDTKAKTVDMTRRIETAMENEIKALDWMTDATKAKALEKLHAVANKVGYPDRWRDYSSVVVKPNDYFGNASRATLFESKRELAKIGKPVDRGEWGMTPPTVNAYYNPQMNDINFPAGVLQPPLYDPKLDDAPNYGNTGSTIGHELTHAFDDEGAQFDAHGNLKNWWTPDDQKKFEERVQCVRDQYAQYTIVDDIKINSKLTSGEDVADLGGTLIAYIAWKDATAGQNLQPVEGFTPDQRFFIGFAQWACENQRIENLRVSALTNPHSPGKYRINGIVSDLPQFQKAFDCKDTSPMVRGAKECQVW